MREAERDYDSLTYTTRSNRQCQPENLWIAGHLLGFSAPAPDRARVLEIGCGVGTDLLAFGLAFPNASAVGIDISGVQIEIATNRAKRLGVSSVEFQKHDLTDLPDDFGEFDYIIAHGLYSWVPAEVRESLMQVVRRHLAPHGMAMVSFNALPRWGGRSVSRRLMQRAARDATNPVEAVELSRKALRTLAENARGSSPIVDSIRVTSRLLDDMDANYIYHDWLATFNEPFWFRDFAAHAGREQLQVLGDAKFSLSCDLTETSSTQEAAAAIEDPIERRQFLDIMGGSGFHSSLLVHASRKEPRPDPLQVIDLRVSSFAAPEGELDMTDGVEADFRGTGYRSFGVSSELMKAALVEMKRIWPATIAVDELLDVIRPSFGDRYLPWKRGMLLNKLAAGLLYLHAQDQVFFHCREVPIATEVGDRPRAFPLSAETAENNRYATNLRYEDNAVDVFQSAVLQLLDGERDRDTVTAELLKKVDSGQLDIDEKTEDAIRERLDACIEPLRKMAMLEAG